MARPPEGDPHLPEENESVWTLTLAPALWVAHFMACYVTAAIFCAKVAAPGGSLGSVRIAIAVYTAVALAGIGMIGRDGLRRHRVGLETEPHDFDSAGDRHRFLGFATLLLSGLSAVATLYVALAAAFIGDCR
jgi:hypothetical protein